MIHHIKSVVQSLVSYLDRMYILFVMLVTMPIVLITSSSRTIAHRIGKGKKAEDAHVKETQKPQSNILGSSLKRTTSPPMRDKWRKLLNIELGFL